MAKDDIPRDSGARQYSLCLEIIKTTGRVVPYIAITVTVYFVYLAIVAVAGTTTQFKFFHTISLEILGRSLPWWLLTICTVLWAIIENALRRRKTEKLAGRIAKLESQLDPNRTSSGLTPSGDTHPDDDERNGE